MCQLYYYDNLTVHYPGILNQAVLSSLASNGALFLRGATNAFEINETL